MIQEKKEQKKATTLSAKYAEEDCNEDCLYSVLDAFMIGLVVELVSVVFHPLYQILMK